jgi:hypothetical protein
VLATPRSHAYLAAVARLDAGLVNQVDVADVSAQILAEFGLGASVPVGLVSKCFLGEPYEVHMLSLAGQILEHFVAAQPMPQPFEGARSMAEHSAYVVIEVYSDRFVCIRTDGKTTEVGHR